MGFESKGSLLGFYLTGSKERPPGLQVCHWYFELPTGAQPVDIPGDILDVTEPSTFEEPNPDPRFYALLVPNAQMPAGAEQHARPDLEF